MKNKFKKKYLLEHGERENEQTIKRKQFVDKNISRNQSVKCCLVDRSLLLFEKEQKIYFQNQIISVFLLKRAQLYFRMNSFQIIHQPQNVVLRTSAKDRFWIQILPCTPV